MGLEGIILNEINQTEKDKHSISLRYRILKTKLMNKQSKTETDLQIQRKARGYPRREERKGKKEVKKVKRYRHPAAK